MSEPILKGINKNGVYVIEFNNNMIYTGEEGWELIQKWCAEHRNELLEVKVKKLKRKNKRYKNLLNKAGITPMLYRLRQLRDYNV